MMRRDEFEKSLSNPLSFWLSKSKDEVNDLLDSQVGDMVGYNQSNPHHCYDLFEHSLHTVDCIDDTASVLRVAAFFHDIAKPAVAMEKQGRLVFYGHAKKSSDTASMILAKMGYTPDTIKEICFYIKHHDDFISWDFPGGEFNKANNTVDITKENLRRYISKTTKKCSEENFYPDESTWNNLLDLCYADSSAQAEVVFQDGIITDTRDHKLKKIIALRKCLSELMLAE